MEEADPAGVECCYTGKAGARPMNSDAPTHGYEASQDADKRWGFRIKDGDGRVVASGARMDDGGLAVSVNEYNEKGLLTVSHGPLSCDFAPVPANCVEPSTFFYDDEGRIIKRVEPDAGTTLYFYDMAGRLRATRTQEQSTKGTVNVNVYDAFDRVVRTGTWTTSLSESALRAYFVDNSNNALPSSSDAAFSLLAQYYYDKMPERITMGAELYPSTMSMNDFAYVSPTKLPS